MELIKTFNQLGKNDAAIAGGKGASLGEMTQAGIPVPPGFVVLAGTFDRFVEEAVLKQKIDDVLAGVDTEAMSTVEVASAKIQDLILTAAMPADIAEDVQKHFAALGAEHVAVRSSATAEDSASAAWAGQLDSFLNTTEAELLRNVQRCWASLFTPRAIFYRFEKGLHTTKISVAVVVQKMVHSDVSGIAFSVHPVTEDRNQLIIEAGYGLGEAIVSGQVTPDSYVVEKTPRKISEVNVSTQTRGLYRAAAGGPSTSSGQANEWRVIAEPKASAQTLEAQQIHELAEIVLRIENHYGFPCDIEWAYATDPEDIEGKFYIVQSRPITTLSPTTPAQSFVSPELANFVPEDYKFIGLWKSDPFPIYFWAHWFNKDLLAKLGFSLSLSGTFSIKAGNFFYHKRALEWGREETKRMVEDTSGSRSAAYRAHAGGDFVLCLEQAREIAGQEPTPATFAHFRDSGLHLMTYWTTANILGFEIDEYIAKQAIAEKMPAEDVAGLIPKFPNHVAEQQNDAKRLLALLKEKKLDNLLENPDQLAVAIREDSSLKTTFDEHVHTYGWLELINYVGTPLSLERLLEQLKNIAPAHTHSESAAKLSPEFKHILRVAGDLGFIRQGAAESSSMYHYVFIPFLEKTAKMLGLTYREMTCLTPDEIIDALGGKTSKEQYFAAIAKRQGGNWLMYSRPDTEEYVIVDEKADVEVLYAQMVPTADPNATSLTGQVGNKGKIQGTVSIVMATDDFHKFKEGNVLVTTMTTPDFVILMQKSAAIVTDIGGMLSHAAIVSRELGKPCVIGTKFATQILKDGDMVEVDADKGVVRKI